MSWKTLALFVAVCALSLTSVAEPVQAATEQKTVKGRVLDANGAPVSGAIVGDMWTNNGQYTGEDEGVMAPFKQCKATCDSDGKFTLEKIAFWGQAVAVMAMDAERKCGAYVLVDFKDDAATDITITLQPLVTVKGSFTCKELKNDNPFVSPLVQTAKERTRVCSFVTKKDGTFELKLPPGTYNASIYAGIDCQSTARKLELAADKTEMDLGAIDLKASIIAKHYGKAPPAWSVGDVRNGPKDLSLATLKGKWVLVEFWNWH